MSFTNDDEATSLEDVRRRLEATDLIPSHQPLLADISRKFAALEKCGCSSLRELRARLKSAKGMAALAKDSGVGRDYLTLLRRAVEGFFPKPQPLAAFPWLSAGTVAKLKKVGVQKTDELHHAARLGLARLASKAGLDVKDLAEPVALSELSRIQWVSPHLARALVAAGFDRSSKVAKASPETLSQAVAEANQAGGFYKGKIGLRDVQRLIVAASYVPKS